MYILWHTAVDVYYFKWNGIRIKFNVTLLVHSFIKVFLERKKKLEKKGRRRELLVQLYGREYVVKVKL